LFLPFSTLMFLWLESWSFSLLCTMLFPITDCPSTACAQAQKTPPPPASS
jgi:hypothetical protein